MKKISILFIIGIFLVMSGCADIESSEVNDLKNDTETAQNTLIAFFDSLEKNDFKNAVSLFSPYDFDWENLKVYNEPDETDRVKMIRNYCYATTTCMKAEVLNIRKITDDEYSMVVRFFKKMEIYMF